MKFEKASDVQKLVKRLIKKLKLSHIKGGQIFCLRSYGSKVRAHARIWGLNRIFQQAAGLKPIYVIEVLSKHFDKLSDREKTKVLIHELLHIPKTFSGALLSHRGRYHRIGRREIEKWFRKLEKSNN